MSVPLPYNATLVAREELSPDTAIFRVAPDQPDHDGARWYEPGQYLVLGMNHPQRGPVRRPMTIVSSSSVRQEVELYFNRVRDPHSDNPLTHLIWEQPVGARLHLRTIPAGTFTVRDTVGTSDARLRVCLAGGTGLAPFVAFVRGELAARPDADLSNYVLLHIAGCDAELGYRDELTALRDSRGLRYAGVVGELARVLSDQDALCAQLGLDRSRLGPESAAVFVCGLGELIAAAIETLLARGFVPMHRKLRRALEVDDSCPSSLFFEQYDSPSLFNLRDPDVAALLRERFRSGSGRR